MIDSQIKGLKIFTSCKRGACIPQSIILTETQSVNILIEVLEFGIPRTTFSTDHPCTLMSLAMLIPSRLLIFSRLSKFDKVKV